VPGSRLLPTELLLGDVRNDDGRGCQPTAPCTHGLGPPEIVRRPAHDPAPATNEAPSARSLTYGPDLRSLEALCPSNRFQCLPICTPNHSPAHHIVSHWSLITQVGRRQDETRELACERPGLLRAMRRTRAADRHHLDGRECELQVLSGRQLWCGPFFGVGEREPCLPAQAVDRASSPPPFTATRRVDPAGSQALVYQGAFHTEHR
jgi:hypothetical protein